MAAPMSKALLKANLGLYGDLPEPVSLMLDHDLDASCEMLLNDGIEIDECRHDHVELLVMHAAWLYRKRANGEGKPRMLTQAIHDMQTHLATGGRA